MGICIWLTDSEEQGIKNNSIPAESLLSLMQAKIKDSEETSKRTQERINKRANIESDRVALLLKNAYNDSFEELLEDWHCDWRCIDEILVCKDKNSIAHCSHGVANHTIIFAPIDCIDIFDHARKGTQVKVHQVMDSYNIDDCIAIFTITNDVYSENLAVSFTENSLEYLQAKAAFFEKLEDARFSARKKEFFKWSIKNKSDVGNSKNDLGAMLTFQELLQLCKLDGYKIQLPEAKTYNCAEFPKFKKELEKIGAKYTKNAFEFPFNPIRLFEALKAGESKSIFQRYQFFPTAESLVLELIRGLELEGKTVLEPSAGRGNIAEILRQNGANVYCIEYMPENVEILQQNGFNALELDFLEYQNEFDCKFDVVVANPPFSNNQDIKHFYKMYDLLEIGGQLRCILSTQWIDSDKTIHKKFRDFISNNGGHIEPIAKSAFQESNTNVASVIVSIVKKVISPQVDKTSKSKPIAAENRSVKNSKKIKIQSTLF
jgi:predicted RNA methylase